MFRVELPELIVRIISVFYLVGVWHRKEEPTVGEMRLKFVYSFAFVLFIISMIAGAIGSVDIDELIFIAEFILMATVFLVKLLYIIWRKKEILELMNRICVYSTDDRDKFNRINDKLDILMKFTAVFFGSSYFCGFCITLVIPFLGDGRTLFINIGFPLDWKNNEFAYWMAFTFMFAQIFIALIASLLTAIIWCLMTNCGLRYKVLGQQIKTMGKAKPVERIGIANGRKISYTERDNLYLRDLLECIDSHTHLKRLINALDSFLSEIFVVQLTTSALCICCSIYCLAFATNATSVEYIIFTISLVYNIFDIFMIMNFGNQIELASDRLSYSFFESDWIYRPQSTKRIVLIFGEFLMKPQQLFILKLYPLNLETFTRILNSAYTTFNILQNFK